MKPAHALRLLACVLTITLAAGCGDACLSLAGHICSCLPDDGTRASCNARAKSQQSSITVRPQDEAFCQKQLDTNACNCNLLGTPEGKLSCGVSFGLVVPPGASQR